MIARTATLTLLTGVLIVWGVPVPVALTLPLLVLFSRGLGHPLMPPYFYIARTDDRGNVVWCIGNRAEAERDARAGLI